MEISYDFSHFYTDFLQEMDHLSNGGNVVSVSGNNNNKKRRANGSEYGGGGSGGGGDAEKSNAVKEILSSLLLLDEEAKFETEKSASDRQQDKSLFDENYEQRSKAMKEYYEKFQEQHSDLNEVDQLRIKRARKSASGIVAASAVAASDTVSSDNSEAAAAAALCGGTIGGGGGGAATSQHRRLWVKDRSKAWWEWCSHPDFPEAEFKKSFRMSRATFDMICEKLDSAVTKKDTMLRAAIPVRQRVAVCIWRLATGEPLRLVSKRFGLGISTCHKLVLEVCLAIRTVLMPMFLKWPNEESLKKIKDEFESESRIPNVAGSMYTTHIPIIAPKISVASYFNKRHTERNQKTSYSITVQGVVDSKGVFTDVSIGWPGSLPDEQVLEKSSLYQSADKGHMKNLWIVANSGYPLTDWLLVPYTHQNLTWTQHVFNEKVAEIQKVAKDAFARLKGRWVCLQKRTEVKLQDLPVVLGACCVLHNICEMSGEEMEPELRFELFDDEMVAENGVRSMLSVPARDHIAHNILHHGRA